jgi:hypothetical protein
MAQVEDNAAPALEHSRRWYILAPNITHSAPLLCVKRQRCRLQQQSIVEQRAQEVRGLAQRAMRWIADKVCVPLHQHWFWALNNALACAKGDDEKEEGGGGAGAGARMVHGPCFLGLTTTNNIPDFRVQFGCCRYQAQEEQQCLAAAHQFYVEHERQQAAAAAAAAEVERLRLEQLERERLRREAEAPYPLTLSPSFRIESRFCTGATATGGG